MYQRIDNIFEGLQDSSKATLTSVTIQWFDCAIDSIVELFLRKMEIENIQLLNKAGYLILKKFHNDHSTYNEIQSLPLTDLDPVDLLIKTIHIMIIKLSIISKKHKSFSISNIYNTIDIGSKLVKLLVIKNKSKQFEHFMQLFLSTE